MNPWRGKNDKEEARTKNLDLENKESNTEKK